MAKNLEISILLDFYGEMLTDKQRDAVGLYYNEDLSLAEIAEHLDITRQGVRDSIKRAENQLLECEQKLGLVRRFDRIQTLAQAITDNASALLSDRSAATQSLYVRQRIQNILRAADEIGF